MKTILVIGSIICMLCVGMRIAPPQVAYAVSPNCNASPVPNVDLSGCTFIGHNFMNKDLRGANFTDANLHQAGFDGANLSGADLVRADLTFSDLSNVNLRGADLTDADLTGAPRIFINPNFAGAIWSNTICPDGSVVTGTPCVDPAAPPPAPSRSQALRPPAGPARCGCLAPFRRGPRG